MLIKENLSLFDIKSICQNCFQMIFVDNLSGCLNKGRYELEAYLKEKHGYFRKKTLIHFKDKKEKKVKISREIK